jgi:hypothetical protein
LVKTVQLVEQGVQKRCFISDFSTVTIRDSQMEHKSRTISLRIVAGVLIATVIIVAIFASGVQLPNTQAPSTQLETGHLTVLLKDAPVDVDELWITITELEVHKSGDDAGWIPIDFLQSEDNVTFNLLEYQDENMLGLADVEIGTGNYTKIRMSVIKAEAWYYEVDENSAETDEPAIDKVELKVPSNKLDVITKFTITDGDNVVVLIDMQPDYVSISHSKNLRPVLKATVSQGGNQ